MYKKKFFFCSVYEVTFFHRYEIFPSTGLKTLQTMKFSHDHKSMSMFINIKWTLCGWGDFVLRHVNCFRFIIIISSYFFVLYFNFEDILCAFITINHFRKMESLLIFIEKFFGVLFFLNNKIKLFLQTGQRNDRFICKVVISCR